MAIEKTHNVTHEQTFTNLKIDSLFFSFSRHITMTFINAGSFLLPANIADKTQISIIFQSKLLIHTVFKISRKILFQANIQIQFDN